MRIEELICDALNEQISAEVIMSTSKNRPPSYIQERKTWRTGYNDGLRAAQRIITNYLTERVEDEDVT